MTPAEQDADLAAIIGALPPAPPSGFTAERSRHDATTSTTVWLFWTPPASKRGKARPVQIGVAVREGETWRASRVAHGVPTSLRPGLTLDSAVDHITSAPLVEYRA